MMQSTLPQQEIVAKDIPKTIKKLEVKNDPDRVPNLQKLIAFLVKEPKSIILFGHCQIVDTLVGILKEEPSSELVALCSGFLNFLGVQYALPDSFLSALSIINPLVSMLK
ncbi:MAG: hypothetical protein EZS28_014553 [Streblomastix strix]|uniref:Uncharacterized protein n=1 Tax=Streblomastix strix TaxID=222440 RepID=A0A5J4W4S1_9EUKA|nr:MAG: hypothetical protein EZS28_014553 [Streblomastix strix]